MTVACDMLWREVRWVVVVMLARMKMGRFALVVQAVKAKAVAVASACLSYILE